MVLGELGTDSALQYLIADAFWIIASSKRECLFSNTSDSTEDFLRTHGMKRLLNRTEERTNQVLQPLVEKWGARAFPKVRVADVLEIENSGINDSLYRYALQSHFDFIVTDGDLHPIFAIEFDGESHLSETQQIRDQQKNALCKRHGLPILRINSRYLDQTYRQMDVLSWFIHYWFAQKIIDDAYESGALPADAYVDPASFVSLSEVNQNRFPLWLTVEVRSSFIRSYEKGDCLDRGPSSWVGIDESGAYRAIAFMAVTETEGLFVESGMRPQQFPVPLYEILDAIIDHQIFEQFRNVLNRTGTMVSLNVIVSRLSLYSKYRMAGSSVGTQSELLRSAIPSMFKKPK